ncbi:MAG: hypothetical protein Q7S74_01540 [Nanoarchaeota archaeon]|nr:hypothetical protein [Nanoarchaeota archaeon]
MRTNNHSIRHIITVATTGLASLVYSGCANVNPTGLPNYDITEGRTFEVYEGDIQNSPNKELSFKLESPLPGIPISAEVFAADSIDGRQAPFNADAVCKSDGNCYIDITDNDNSYLTGSTWKVIIRGEPALGFDTMRIVNVTYSSGQSNSTLTTRVEDLENQIKQPDYIIGDTICSSGEPPTSIDCIPKTPQPTALETLLGQSHVNYFDANWNKLGNTITSKAAYAQLSIPNELAGRLTSNISVNVIERSNPNSWIRTNYSQPSAPTVNGNNVTYNVPLNFDFDYSSANKGEWEVIDPQFSVSISNGTFVIGDTPEQVNLKP